MGEGRRQRREEQPGFCLEGHEAELPHQKPLTRCKKELRKQPGACSAWSSWNSALCVSFQQQPQHRGQQEMRMGSERAVEM